MAVQLQMRRGTAAAWTSANPTLLAGEWGLETDTKLYKVGDGTTAWNSLAYPSITPSTTVELKTVQSSIVGSNPSSGQVKFYSTSQPHAGRPLLATKDNPNEDVFLDDALWHANPYCLFPGATTVPTVFGGPAFTAVGTVSHPAQSSGGYLSQTRRIVITSAATASAPTELRTAIAPVWRGSSSGLGGFFVKCVFGITLTPANRKGFIGLTTSAAALAGTADPETMINCVGVGWNANSPYMFLVGGGATLVSTSIAGGDFDTSFTQAWFEVTIYCESNSSECKVSLRNIESYNVATATFSNTNLPDATAFLTFRAWASNGTTASAMALAIRNIYIKTKV